MRELNGILESFEPVSLAGIESLKLMHRTETKFLMSCEKLPGILEKLSLHYKVLQVEGLFIFSYKNLYYDTGDLKLYLAHHNARASRYKIRYRNYADSGHGFMEIKFKSNKQKTLKTRIAHHGEGPALSEEAKNFIRNSSGFDPGFLKPVVWVNYKRITLVGEDERVTFDMGLEFLKDGLQRTMPDLVIAEVKQRNLKSSPAVTILKQEKARETSVSKYCLAITATHPGVKQNNFKQKIKIIKKIQ